MKPTLATILVIGLALTGCSRPNFHHEERKGIGPIEASCIAKTADKLGMPMDDTPEMGTWDKTVDKCIEQTSSKRYELRTVKGTDDGVRWGIDVLVRIDLSTGTMCAMADKPMWVRLNGGMRLYPCTESK